MSRTKDWLEDMKYLEQVDCEYVYGWDEYQKELHPNESTSQSLQSDISK